jgi:hypothetical protein
MGFGKTIVSRSWIKDTTPSYADAAKNQEAMNASPLCLMPLCLICFIDPGSKSNVNQSKVT